MFSQIFVDSGNALETEKAKKLLGHIDGQTTNPTLISKNPEVQEYLLRGKKLTQTEALNLYKNIVIDIAKIVKGPISIQVIADKETEVAEMLKQAKNYHTWIPNAVVKFPITYNGLAAAEKFCEVGSVNLTLNFSQSQAAAVCQATKKAKHLVFISPFVGRLDVIGINGMQLVANELRMLESSNQHVKILTSSVRKIEHLYYALNLKSPAITVPLSILESWKENDLNIPGSDYLYNSADLKPIPYKPIALDQNWQKYDIAHELTLAGLTKFMLDWKEITK